METPTGLFRINRQSKSPLYTLIEENFRDLFLDGRLKTGETIPSEWELAEMYGVSRLTVRHAMDNLVRQGWLNRRHGVGTFVANPRVAEISPSRLSFTEQMRAIGRTASSRQIGIQTLPATSEIAAHLHIQEGDPVIEITRVRLADGEPMVFETSYLSQKRFPGLDESIDLSDKSLYEYLNTKYQTTIAAMDQTLEPVLMAESEAVHLETQAGALAMYSEVIAFSSEGDPIEYCWSVTRGDKSKFYFSFRRGENIP